MINIIIRNLTIYKWLTSSTDSWIVFLIKLTIYIPFKLSFIIVGYIFWEIILFMFEMLSSLDPILSSILMILITFFLGFIYIVILEDIYGIGPA